MIIQLALLFFLVAFLYSMVGFGGGSSYIALLALFLFDYKIIPQLALICNLIVVSGGCYHFIKKKHFYWSLFWPFAITSVPFAYIGGRIPVSKQLFFLLLGTTLIIASVRILYSEWFISGTQENTYKKINIAVALFAGAVLGLLSGLVGIGGGIFLAPLLINLEWGKAKQIAATCSAFICVNSIAGLLGQSLKNSMHLDIIEHWPLFLSVLVGGQIGSRLVTTRISSVWLKTLTAFLILFVGCRILLK